MMRSRALVLWGRCWTEAPVAEIAMGITWILVGGAARFAAINRALFVGRCLKKPKLRNAARQGKSSIIPSRSTTLTWRNEHWEYLHLWDIVDWILSQ
jgi:hypothetical protein